MALAGLLLIGALALPRSAPASTGARMRFRQSPAPDQLAVTHVITTTGGQPFTCPDPSVIRAPAGSEDHYYLACTSDRETNALPIYKSDDLVHWRRAGYVFPAGAQASWALPSPRGVYWAPDLEHFNGQWYVYFAAEVNPGVVTLDPDWLGDMAIGVAWAPSLGGPWQSKLLRYRHQPGTVASVPEPTSGGVLDPSEFQDSRTGRRYLAFGESGSIWTAALAPDGTTLSPDIYEVQSDRAGWESDPPTGTPTVEGPSVFTHAGRFYLLFSGANTWDSSYAIGAAVSSSPTKPFTLLTTGQPLLQSSKVWLGPGGCPNPVVGPDHRTYLFYHAALIQNPGHVSELRDLLVSRFRWDAQGLAHVGDGMAGS